MPIHWLAAHLGQAVIRAHPGVVHQQDHRMAADAAAHGAPSGGYVGVLCGSEQKHGARLARGRGGPVGRDGRDHVHVQFAVGPDQFRVVRRDVLYGTIAARPAEGLAAPPSPPH